MQVTEVVEDGSVVTENANPTKPESKKPRISRLRNILLSIAACVILVAGSANLTGDLRTLESRINTGNPIESVENIGNYQCNAGMNLLLIRGIEHERIDSSLDEMQAAGIDCVAINLLLQQDGQFGSEVFQGENTIGDEALIHAIEQAHSRGMKVTIRPLIDEVGFTENYWRGTMSPSDVERWFQSYTQEILRYAELAEAHNVEVFNIGAELASMEQYTEQWETLIEEVRGVYSGLISYSVNAVGAEDRLWFRHPDLNMLGFDVYIRNEAYDVEEDITGKLLAEIGDIIGVEKDISVVYYIAEAGAIARGGSNLESNNWVSNEPPSYTSQMIVYREVCRAAKALGLGTIPPMWWAVKLHPDYVEVDGFNPLGTPTEALVDCEENN